MKKTTAILAGFLIAACGESDTVQSATEVEQTVIELPEFNTYSDAQMAVLSAFGMAEFDASAVSPVPLRDGFGVIFGYGGNVLVSVGEDGVIMVDNQFPEVTGHFSMRSENSVARRSIMSSIPTGTLIMRKAIVRLAHWAQRLSRMKTRRPIWQAITTSIWSWPNIRSKLIRLKRDRIALILTRWIFP